jgi:RNA polymerase-binding protein DksA
LGRKRAQHKDEVLRAAGAEASGGISNVPLHPADLGSHEYEEAVTMNLVEGEEQFLEEVNDALGRMESGAFGVCEQCGKKIAKARLQAVPYARYCIKCAREKEAPAEA